MKTKIPVIKISIFCSLLFFSCKKNTTEDVKATIPKKIYVLSEEETGSNGDYAVKYRVDGTVTTVVDGINYSGRAIDMKIQDTNVYVLAERHHIQNNTNEYVVFKNGTAVQTFIANTNSFYAEAIAVTASDLYVIGEEFVQSASASKIKYWKNGSFTDVTNASVPSYALSANIINGSLYIAGVESNTNSTTDAIIWKNGVKTSLPGLAGSTRIAAYDFAVSGSDIYAAGYSNEQACIWKNGVVSALPSLQNKGKATGITISGNDVYVCGGVRGSSPSQYWAAYWKNGTIVNLTSTSTDAEASDIAVNGSDVYVSGYNSLNGNIYQASYWKNGSETVFTATGKSGDVKRIIAQ